MTLEQASVLVLRMTQEPELAQQMVEVPEEVLDGLDLTDPELEAVLADAVTIHARRDPGAEVSGFSSPAGLRVTRLPGFDAAAFPDLVGDPR